MNEIEYEKRFNRVGNHLFETAHKLSKGLYPIDVCGLYFATGIEYLRLHGNDADVVAYIRRLADGLEAGSIGIKPNAEDAH